MPRLTVRGISSSQSRRAIPVTPFGLMAMVLRVPAPISRNARSRASISSPSRCSSIRGFPQRPLPELAEVPPRVQSPTYKQDWPNYNLAQPNEKFHFQDLLTDLCRTVPEPAWPRRPGASRSCSPMRSSPPSKRFTARSRLDGSCATWKASGKRTHQPFAALQ